MYQRILLAYDGSESGQRALLESSEFAHWSQSELHLIAVVPLLTAPIWFEVAAPLARPDIELQNAQQLIQRGVTRLQSLGCRASGEVVSGDAVNEICAMAHSRKADLIVVGHKHQNSWAARWWSNDVSRSLIEQSPCSVLVVITH